MRRKPVWLRGADIALLVGASVIRPTARGSAGQEFHPVKRNEFMISIVASGTLGAVTEVFVFSSRRRHTRFDCDWSSGVCSSDLAGILIHKLITRTLFNRKMYARMSVL